MSANRTTDDWKFQLRGNYNRNTSSTELEDTTITTLREDWSTNLLLVKSLTPHWSVGMRSSLAWPQAGHVISENSSGVKAISPPCAAGKTRSR